MAITTYKDAKGRTWHRVDVYVRGPDGSEERIRKKRIPTREQAVAFEAKAIAQTFEGRNFEVKRRSTATVTMLLDDYEKIAKRDNDSWRSDVSRSKHLRRLLGPRRAESLIGEHVEEYRNARFAETTRLGKAPSPGTLDREVELLKRVLNHFVGTGRLDKNPIAHVELLRKPNVREVVVSQPEFEQILERAADRSSDGRAQRAVSMLLAVALTSFDTGMRKGEVLALKRSQVDFKEGVIRLGSAQTKDEKPRTIHLMRRTVEVLKKVPPVVGSPWVFTNPRKRKTNDFAHYKDLRGVFNAAKEAAKLDHVRFHDLRRSFATHAIEIGIPQAVVMAMGGWKSDAVFRRYGIVRADGMKDAARALEAAREASRAPDKDETVDEGKS